MVDTSTGQTTKLGTLHVIALMRWQREGHETFEVRRARLLDALSGLLAQIRSVGEGEAVESGRLKHVVLSGQTVILEDAAAVRPDLLALLVIANAGEKLGVGPWYVQVDQTLVSGEALVRNLLLARTDAQRYGVKLMPVAYVPGAGGYSAQLPQILRGFGIDAALLSHTAPINHLPFRWEALNNSSVLVINHDDTDTPGGDDKKAIAALLKDQKAISPDGPYLWLHSGGGESVEPLLKSLKAAVNVPVEQATMKEYVAELRRALPDELRPALKGELRMQDLREYSYLLPGRLSARMYLKQANTRLQNRLNFAVEPLVALALTHGKVQYPDNLRALLDYGWRMLLKNQSHNALGGNSVDAVHEESEIHYRQIEDIAAQVIDSALRALPGEPYHEGMGFETAPPPKLTTSEQYAILVGKTGPLRALDAKLANDKAAPESEAKPKGEAQSADLTIVSTPDTAAEAKAPDSPATAASNLPAKPSAEVVDSAAAPAPVVTVEAPAEPDTAPESDTTFTPVPVASSASNTPDDEDEDTAEFIPVVVPPEPEPESEPKPALRTYIVVWNPHSWTARQVVEASVRLPEGQHPIRIVTPGGEELNFGWMPGAASGGTVSFLAEVPPVGYTTYTVELGSKRSAGHATESTPGTVIGNVAGETLVVENEQLVWKRGDKPLVDLLRMVDGGDAGDTYNYSPPSRDVMVTADLLSHVQVLTSPVYSRLVMQQRMRVTPGLDEKRGRVRGLKLLEITTTATFYDQMPGIYFRTTFENSARDHRLRAHVRTGIAADTVLADTAFGLVSRKTALEGPEFPGKNQPNTEGVISTYPMHSLCAVENGSSAMALLGRGLPEFEALHEDGQTTLALTLVRAVGWLSRDDLLTRRASVAPQVSIMGAQCLRPMTAEFALMAAASKDPAGLLQAGQMYNAPLQVYQYGRKPNSVTRSYLEVAGEGVVMTALKPPASGEGWIARFVNPGEAEREISVAPFQKPDKALLVNMAEEPQAEFELNKGRIKVKLKPHEVVTVRFEFA